MSEDTHRCCSLSPSRWGSHGCATAAEQKFAAASEGRSPWYQGTGNGLSFSTGSSVARNTYTVANKARSESLVVLFLESSPASDSEACDAAAPLRPTSLSSTVPLVLRTTRLALTNP